MKNAILFCLIFLVGCHSSPENILPQDQMQSVLWDMMQADEMADYYAAKDSTFKTMKKHVEYYQTIFSLHKTNKQTFINSLNYYEAHPEKFQSVLDSLQIFSEKAQKADSLKKRLFDSAGKKPIQP